MKKGYFIAYLGAVATMSIVLSKATKMTKKYGQPLKEKKKTSPEKLAKTAEKGIDFVAKKIAKQYYFQASPCNGDAINIYGVTMKKVIVIGCPGSGKTTFAEKLNRCTGLPLYYLDAIWHKPDKTHISREDFDQTISEIFNTSKWIIDGNYKRTIEIRLKECDAVFLFDLPTEICIQGATERIGKGRYDMPWLETELDPEFKSFIEDFPKDTLPYIYELIEKYKDDKQVIIFKSRQDADEYIKNNCIYRHF